MNAQAQAKAMFYHRKDTNTYVFHVSVPGPQGPAVASALKHLMAEGIWPLDKSKAAVKALIDQAQATGWVPEVTND